MRKTIIAICLAATTSVASAGNLATCILGKMPDVNNDVAARATLNFCREKYPLGYYEIERGAGLGMLGYGSPAECASKKAASAKSNVAGQLIYYACKCLYETPVFDGQMCAYR